MGYPLISGLVVYQSWVDIIAMQLKKKFFWGIGRINAIYHLPTKIDPKYYGSPVFRGGSSLSFKPHGRVFVECYPRPRSDRHVGVGPNFQIQPSFGPETVWRRSHWKWLVRLVFSGEGHGRRTTDRPGWCFQGGKKKHCKTNGDFTNKRQGYQTFLDSVLMIGIVIANKRGRWLPICLVLHSANGMMISLDQSIVPHIFVWGSCFWFCIPLLLLLLLVLLPLRRLPDTHTTLSHTIFHTQLCHTPSFAHLFVTHYLLHTTLSHTSLSHTHHLSHTTLSHTSLSHTIFYKQLGHTRSFTHNFVTHTHTHHISHTTLSHAIFHTQLCHTPSFTHNFVAHFAWQGWHSATWT